MATGDEDSSEREEVPFSLVPPHDMTRLIVENKNVAARGSDLDRSDVESDNVSKDSGGDAIHHDNTNNLTSLRSRSSNYNENEILILARAWVQVSTDPATGTDQKSAHFWNRVLIAYTKFIAITNIKYSKKDGELYTVLPEDRTIKSLKSQWYNRLLPIASKFSAIEEMNPPNSGEQYDNGDLTSYYACLRNDIYPKQAGKLPKKIDQYMKAYFFLKDQPKFSQVIERSSSDKKRTNSPAGSIQQPPGRGSAKKLKAMDVVIDSVKKSIKSSFATSSNTGATEILELKEGLKKANETMESLVNHQLMTMAPSPIKKKYFDDVFANILEAEATKKLKLILERKRLEIDLQNMNSMESELTSHDNSNYERPLEENTVQNLPRLLDNDCCWGDDCQFIGIPGPELNECGRSECSSGERFHHVCMVCWVEKRDPNPECVKWCRGCCVEKYGL